MAYEETSHVFISYVHEDSAEVGELCAALKAAQIPYWRDRKDIGPGDAWRAKIRSAIKDGCFVFLACFSANSRAKQKSYMNEELNLAVEEFRKMPPGRVWLIPVRFSPDDVPQWDLGAGLTLADLDFADLFGECRTAQLERLVAAIRLLLSETGHYLVTGTADVDKVRGPDRKVPLPRAAYESEKRSPGSLGDPEFDRTYELLDSSAILSRSKSNSSTCDMRYTARRRVTAHVPEGIRSIAIDFTRDTELMLPFNSTNQPDLSLVNSMRTGGGRLDLARPRKTTGSSFVQDVAFTPPLRMDETSDFTVDANLPAYKFAYLEDLVSGTIGSPMGVREYEMLSRIISYPTELLVMKVFLPDHIRASPIGPKVGRASTVNHLESTALISSSAYNEWVGEKDGAAGVFMELRVSQPKMNRRYRLAWALPRHSE